MQATKCSTVAEFGVAEWCLQPTLFCRRRQPDRLLSENHLSINSLYSAVQR